VTLGPRPSRQPVTFRCFPRADRGFHRVVEQLIAADPSLDPRDRASAARLEAQLQVRFPGASVRLQDPLATFGAEAPLWYVYRRDEPAPGEDQAQAPSAVEAGVPQEADAGPRAASTSRLSSGPGSRPVYSVSAASSMVGVPLASVVGWDAEGLVRPSVTRGGQNLYSRDDIEDLVFVKRQVTAGTPPDQIARALGERRARRAAGTSERVGARRLLVLLAERDPYAAEYAEYFLRTEGYDVEVAFDMAEAQQAADTLGPDLAVVELLISAGSGPELCARLKASGTAAVLAISSLDDEDIALRAGADAFLAKPLDPLQFVSTVKDLLGESAMLHSGARR
jgi:CheY-like chemotaxis protein